MLHEYEESLQDCERCYTTRLQQTLCICAVWVLPLGRDVSAKSVSRFIGPLASVWLSRR